MGISGIIRPPPDIRAVADRTALFVSKNGRAFENKILNSEKGKTPKFAFLHETSPFHAYYEHRIRFYEEGGTDEDERRKEEEDKLRNQKETEERERDLKEKEEKEKEAAQKKREAARKKASAVDPVARSLLANRGKISEVRSGGTGPGYILPGDDFKGSLVGYRAKDGSGPQPPPALRHVTLAAPSNLTPLEIEVIKLTAQYVAISERGGNAPGSDNFLSNLTLREWTNPEFMFLQPRHAHFAYFTALVEGYRSFLPGGDEYEEAQRKIKIDSKKERLAHLIPDDYLTKNIDQTADKSNVIAQCLDAAAYRAEYERDVADRWKEATESAEGGGTFGGAGTVDWHDFVVVETIDFPVDEAVEALPPPTSLRLAVLTKEEQKAEELSPIEEKEEPDGKDDDMDQSSSDEDEDMGNNEGEGEELKVVSNYQPKVVSTKEITGDASRTQIIDPITGKSVAIADMPEHMRIQLLDPKWAEERRRFLDKQRETNFVAGDDIASNITRFAQARGDLFGSSEDELRDIKADSGRRLAEANRLIREQIMQQPQMQPQPPVMPTIPPGIAAALVPIPPGLPPSQPLAGIAPPPPGHLSTLVAHPPPPLPSMQQHNSDVLFEQPAAKRPKLDEAEIIQNPATNPLAQSGHIDTEPTSPKSPAQPFVANVISPPAAPTQDILSEADFVATLSNPESIPISIRIPNDVSNVNWNFNGQTIELTFAATSKIKDLKESLKNKLGGMPINKMQLKHPSSGFMNKDGLSLGHFNVGPGMTLDLVPKIRGGRK